MKLTPDVVLMMARYNAWQNKQLQASFATLYREALTQDRGAFFGSILATANHLLWGDSIWMARFTGKGRPPGGFDESTRLTDSAEAWAVERFRLDGEILLWAEKLRAVDLTGPLSWYSGSIGAEVSKPRAQCVLHFFNHQTHHRGQIHGMLTAAGAKGPVSDLIFMPDEGPWL
ncbi:DinB family protein [Sagittula sp. S175]|uniref:DinB family protein n=1 Tax=Sagittula sp. S175 TaxID=3415129 RepID=UPI003C79FDBD